MGSSGRLVGRISTKFCLRTQGHGTGTKGQGHEDMVTGLGAQRQGHATGTQGHGHRERDYIDYLKACKRNVSSI